MRPTNTGVQMSEAADDDSSDESTFAQERLRRLERRAARTEAADRTDEQERLRRVAFRAVSMTLSPSARSEFDDIVQVALIEYYNFATTHDVANPEALITIVARRLGWKRRNKWEFQRRHAMNPDELDDSEEFGLRIPDLVSEAGDRAFVEWAIGHLPEQRREIATLAFLADPPLNGREIAEHLELAEGTVRNNLVKIRRDLRELIAAPEKESYQW